MISSRKRRLCKIVSKDGGKTFYKQEIVKHDDVPHGFNDENSRHAYELIKSIYNVIWKK